MAFAKKSFAPRSSNTFSRTTTKKTGGYTPKTKSYSRGSVFTPGRSVSKSPGGKFSTFDNAYHPASWYAPVNRAPVTRSLNAPTSPIPGGDIGAMARAALAANRARAGNAALAARAPTLGRAVLPTALMAANRARPGNAATAAIAPRLGATAAAYPSAGGYGGGVSSPSYGGGNSGGGVTRPTTPTVLPPNNGPAPTPPPVVAPPAPPVTAPGVPTPTTGGFTTNRGTMTAGMFNRMRNGRGPMTNMSMTPEMLMRLARQRYSQQG